jgi:hypothetical protein
VNVACPYCEQSAVLVTGAVIYPRLPELADKAFYRCAPCEAHVGCHPGTTTPLGGLANKELRMARIAAHQAFDGLWRVGRMKRGHAYQWLASQLGIDQAVCHIGQFDVAQCQRVVDACNGLTVEAGS